MQPASPSTAKIPVLPSPSPPQAQVKTAIVDRLREGEAPSGVIVAPESPRPDTANSAMLGNRLCATCGSRYPDDFVVCPRDATPLTWASEDEDVDRFLGTTLAETYKVVRVLGEGGMGRVYEVTHTRLPHRRFALKMLLPEYARNPEIVGRFSREAEAASKIEHDNVIDVYDLGRTPDGLPYLVSELLQGEELGSVLKRMGKVDVTLAVHIVRQVCRGLSAAHTLSVVHRDMKPENLFLVGDVTSPRVKVLDFGISKVGDAGGENLTRTGVVMGTPAYMAPEQARGERVDHRVDVYAVGAILYRLLTGRTPFDSDDVSAALTAVLTEEPPRPRSLAPEIPEALELVIERAMAKKPDERFASMAELDAALAPFDTFSPGAPVIAADAGKAKSAADTSAPTMLAAPTSNQNVTAQLAHVARETREAQLARPLIITVSLLAFAVVVAGLTDAVASIVSTLTGEPIVSHLTSILILVGVVATLLTPLVLYMRWVAKQVWGSSVRAIAHSRKLRLATFTALSTYGGLALIVRFVEGVLRQSPHEIAWNGWGPVLLFGSLVAAFGAVVLSRFGERK